MSRNTLNTTRIRKMANWSIDDNWNVPGIYFADEDALVYDMSTAYKPTPRGRHAKRLGAGADDFEEDDV